MDEAPRVVEHWLLLFNGWDLWMVPAGVPKV